MKQQPKSGAIHTEREAQYDHGLLGFRTIWAFAPGHRTAGSHRAQPKDPETHACIPVTPEHNYQ